MRTYLRDVIGITDVPGGTVNLRRVAVQTEGLRVIEDFVEFDEDDIQVLCQSVRKPGGTIDDPANPGTNIPNPGYSISAISEKRMKIASYAASIYELIGRPIDHNSMSRDRLRLFEQHKKLVEDHEDPEKLPVVSRNFGIIKAMDLVPTHLRDRLGVLKVPLSYVIRSDENPSPIEPLGVSSIHSDAYENLMEELIVTTPLTGTSYTEDNAKVFQIIQDMVTGTSFEASIKAYQRTRDGRSSYMALCQHNMGTSKWEKIIENAETYLMRREWNGRNQRFSLRSHIGKHREAHNELRRAADFVAYDVPNERIRVSRLLKSLTTRDPAVISAFTHIQGTPAYRTDFEAAADFLLITAPNSGNGSNNDRGQRVSGARTNGKKKGVCPTTGVEFRYYSKKEYGKLTNDQKKSLAEWRANKKRNDENSDPNKDDNDKIASLESTVAALQATIASLTSTNNKKRETKPNPLRNPLSQRQVNFEDDDGED